MYKGAADMPEKMRRLFKLAGVELPEQLGNYKDEEIRRHHNFGLNINALTLLKRQGLVW